MLPHQIWLVDCRQPLPPFASRLADPESGLPFIEVSLKRERPISGR
jgi:hypothetical protein